MNKQEYLQKLEEGLAGVSAEERVAAMQYYTEYFDDAGPEREGEVVEELGTPEDAAAQIRASSGEGESWTPPAKAEQKAADAAQAAPSGDPGVPQLTLEPEMPEFTNAAAAAPEPAPEPPQQASPLDSIFPPGPGDAAWGNAAQQQQQQAGPQGQYAPYGGPGTQYQYAQGGQPQAPYTQQGAAPQAGGSNWDAGKVILLIILAVVLSPVWGGLLSGLVGVLAGALVVLAVPLIVGVALVAAGVASSVLAALVLGGGAVPAGLVALGIALVVLGLGLLCIYLGVWLLRKVIPAIFHGIAALVRKIAGWFKRPKTA